MKAINEETSIQTNLDAVHSRIRMACEKSGRDEKEVKLLLATKTVPAEKIRMALDTGLYLIGENKVQEALGKFEE